MPLLISDKSYENSKYDKMYNILQAVRQIEQLSLAGCLKEQQGCVVGLELLALR
jgi:hypothetical protein